jgi:hypothetical protein
VAVGDAVAHHAEGALLVFDDSRVHSAFNAHESEDRVVLILDVARPAEAAPGGVPGMDSRKAAAGRTDLRFYWNTYAHSLLAPNATWLADFRASLAVQQPKQFSSTDKRQLQQACAAFKLAQPSWL